VSDYRVEKQRLKAKLTLSNGASVEGWLFVSGGTPLRRGPERIKDLLNAEAGFFPVEPLDGERTALLHRDHVVYVSVADETEASVEAGYEVARQRSVSLLLSNGECLHGRVAIHRPAGRDRLSDYARHPEQFRYLEAADRTLIVNTRHVLQLAEAD
jgi:hypothetical protein